MLVRLLVCSSHVGNANVGRVRLGKSSPTNTVVAVNDEYGELLLALMRPNYVEAYARRNKPCQSRYSGTRRTARPGSRDRPIETGWSCQILARPSRSLVHASSKVIKRTQHVSKDPA
jgi:hypothetical protein